MHYPIKNEVTNKFINKHLLLSIMTSFGEVFGNSINDFKDNFRTLFSLGFIGMFIPALLLLIVSLSMFGRSGYWLVFGLLTLVSIVLSIYVSVGTLLTVHRGNMSVGDAFREASPYFWKVVALSIVLALLLLVLFILLIIPGIIFMIYWMFASLFLIIENKRIGECLDASKQLVKGRWWRVFGCYLLLMIIVIVVSLITTIPRTMMTSDSAFDDVGLLANMNPYSWVSDNPLWGSIISIIEMLLNMFIGLFMVLFGYNFYVGL